MNKAKNLLLNNPLLFSFIIFMIITLILFSFDYFFLTKDNRKDILVEAHGILFDVIIFNILFFIYDRVRKKNDDIKRHKEEIDDLRGKWAFKDDETAANNIEVASKIASRLRKLLSLNVCKDIDLSQCYLAEQTFLEIKISNFEFKSSNLNGISFSYSTIHNSDFEGSSLIQSYFAYADISGCKFSNGAILNGSSFESAKLDKLSVQSSNFRECIFSSVKLDPRKTTYENERSKILTASHFRGREDEIKNDIFPTKLSNSTMMFTDFSESKFEGTKISDTNFSGSIFQQVSFKNAHIVNTNFTDSDCRKTIFDNCIIEGIQMSKKTKFQEASFIEVTFFGEINFRNVLLKGAKFSTSYKPELERQGVDITELIFV